MTISFSIFAIIVGFLFIDALVTYGAVRLSDDDSVPCKLIQILTTKCGNKTDGDHSGLRSYTITAIVSINETKYNGRGLCYTKQDYCTDCQHAFITRSEYKCSKLTGTDSKNDKNKNSEDYLFNSDGTYVHYQSFIACIVISTIMNAVLFYVSIKYIIQKLNRGYDCTFFNTNTNDESKELL
jgi:hypothetical protein